MTDFASNGHPQDGSIPALDGVISPHISFKHRDEWINESGVSEGITELAIRTIHDIDEILKLTGWKKWSYGTGYAIEGVNPETGQKNCLGRQFKPDNPPKFKDSKTGTEGKPHKYINPKGEPTNPLFLAVPDNPQYWPKVQKLAATKSKKTPIKIILTEGAKKAGSGLTEGFPTIDIKGVWNACPKDEGSGLYALNEHLRKFCKPGVEFYLAFDGDFRTNKKVRDALDHLSRLLHKEGCTVKWMIWDKEFKGLDDYYAAKGKGSILALMDSAELWTIKNSFRPAKRHSGQTKDDAPIGKDVQSGCIPGFVSDPKEGLSYLKKTKDGDIPIKVSGHIELKKEVEHLELGLGLHISFVDRYGRTGQHLVLRREVMRDGQELIGELSAKGLWIENDQKKLLLRCLNLMQGNPKQRVIITLRCGWIEKNFVTPDRSYGSQDIRFQDIEPPKKPKQAIKGDVKGWQEEIGCYLTGNPKLLFSSLVPLSAPIASFLGKENGGFHLFGESSKGKTTALNIAASIVGHPKDIGESWNATATALELIGLAHNDQCLFLDEIGQADPRDVAKTVYNHGNGQPKARGTKDVRVRRQDKYSCLMLSTGEYSMVDYLTKAGMPPKSGQEVRLIDIPVESNSGMGVFDNLHDCETPGELAEHLNETVLENHGAVWDAWLTELVKAVNNPDFKDSLTMMIETAKPQIKGFWANQEIAPMINRIVNRLAIIQATGIQAVRWGLINVSEQEVINAVASIFADIMEHRGSGQSRELIQDIEKVQVFIEKNLGTSAIMRLQDTCFGGYQAPSRLVGCIDKNEECPQATELWILPKVFEEEIKANNLKALRAELLRREWLAGYTEKSGRVRYTMLRTFPGIGQTRVYVFKEFWSSSTEEA